MEWEQALAAVWVVVWVVAVWAAGASMTGSRSKKSDPSYYDLGGEHAYRKEAGANLVGSSRTKEDEAMHETAEIAKRGPIVIDKSGKKRKATVGLSTKAIKVHE